MTSAEVTSFPFMQLGLISASALSPGPTLLYVPVQVLEVIDAYRDAGAAGFACLCIKKKGKAHHIL